MQKAGALLWVYIFPLDVLCCVRPYHAEHTPSRPIWQVKQRRARIVLGSETAWEHRVSYAFHFFLQFASKCSQITLQLVLGVLIMYLHLN